MACAWSSSASGAHSRFKKPAFFAAERAAGEQQFAGPALADDARQHGAGAHVAAGQPDPVEQEGSLAARRSQPQVGGHRHDGAGAGADAVDRRHDGLRAGTHGFHQVARHASEHQQLGRLQPHQRADDFMHVAAGAEIVTGTGDHHRMDVGGVFQLAEQVAQLGIRLEGQRVLAFGPVQRDGGDAAAHLPEEVLRTVAGQLLAVAGDQGRIGALN
jgi:hypothetical protein